MRTSRPHRFVAAVMAAGFLLSAAPAAPGSADAPVKTRAHEVTRSVERETTFELPMDASHIALHWPGQPNADLEIAFSTDGSAYTEPVEIEIDDVGVARNDGRTYSTIMTADGLSHVRVTTDKPIPQLSLLIIDSNAPEQGAFGIGATTSAAVNQPAVISRAGWGADEGLRFKNGSEIWPRQFFPIQKLVVHHTAGRNDDPNPAATVRAIYYYHAVTQGWGDIGYNFLIDEAGRVYEGRWSRAYPAGTPPSGDNQKGDGVVAGHARGYNAGTVGVSLLGNFETRLPTAAARQALVRTLSWLSAKHRLDPRGGGNYVNPIDKSTRSMANVSGHRDVSSTACPGIQLYNQLPSIRTQVAREMIERVAGADRYATAASVSAKFFPRNVPVAFVATGVNYPDSVAGGPAAALAGGPVLLTYRTTIPVPTLNELKRLAPARITVLGGPEMVSDAVLNQLKGLAPGGATRIAGADRYETAARISAAHFNPGVAAVFLSTGRKFPDALAVGPAAARLKSPILLTDPTRLPAATAAEIARLQPARIYVLGDPSTVSSGVFDAVKVMAPNGATRIAGADRYATAAAIAKTFFPSTHAAFVAGGSNFPDALAGASPAWRMSGPMLLVPVSGPTAPVTAELKRLRPARVIVLGGPTMISENGLARIRGALGLQ